MTTSTRRFYIGIVNNNSQAASNYSGRHLINEVVKNNSHGTSSLVLPKSHLTADETLIMRSLLVIAPNQSTHIVIHAIVANSQGRFIDPILFQEAAHVLQMFQLRHDVKL